MDREISAIAQDIVPELRLRLDNYLSSDMVLGSKEYHLLSDLLWENKIGILRVLEAGLTSGEEGR
jgi:formyltetrahydrofolate hydrolase